MQLVAKHAISKVALARDCSGYRLQPKSEDVMNPHQQHPSSLLAIFKSLWGHRNLLWQMTKREVVGRYRGSIFGLAWSFFSPVLMLIIYTFVFSVIFKMKWNVGTETSKVDFAVILFAGMIIHGLFAEVVNRAPALILYNVTYVKKVIFPLEILPCVAVGSALFHGFVSVSVLLSFYLITNLSIQWTVVFFPLVILPLLLATTGLSWFLSSMGVFIRDIGQTTSIFTTVMMFLSPVFYPASAVPEPYSTLLHINPLTYVIEESRNVLIWGVMPDFLSWAIYTSAALTVAWIGFWWFQRTRRAFADVI
jgi:lipopolysaccharide transport system permease protein